MRVTRSLIGAALLVAAMPVAARAGGNDTVPPVLVDGARVVDIADAEGGISRYTTIPWNSEFRTHGGRSARCVFTSQFGGTTSDGQLYEPGQRVESDRWMFIEGTLPSFGEPDPEVPLVERGPLADAVRHFAVFCDSVYHFLGTIDVTSRDPMLDPRQRVWELYNGLHLERAVLWPDPVIERWGGLVTRFPTWLAIRPPAWRSQWSNTVTWRGWTMVLVARPVALDHVVSFRPAAGRPAASFDGVVPCVGDGAEVEAVVGSPAFPSVADLPDLAEPGVGGDCVWTPPGPGTVTIEPRITYSVTFWANGYTETLPDYVWSGVPVMLRTGDLTAVNTPG